MGGIHVMEMVVAIILVLFAVVGLKKGLIKTVFSILKIFLAIFLSILISPVVESYVPESLQNIGATFAISFILVMIVLSIVESLLDIVDKIPGVNEINKLTGFIAGIIQGLLLIWATFAILVSVKDWEAATVLNGYIDKSVFLSVIQDANPMMKVMLLLDDFVKWIYKLVVKGK